MIAMYIQNYAIYWLQYCDCCWLSKNWLPLKNIMIQT